MGVCAPNRPKRSKDCQLQLKFEVRTWSKNKHVNFRDYSTSTNQIFSLVLRELETHSLGMVEHQKQNAFLSSKYSSLMGKTCSVVRNKQTFQFIFQGYDIYQSAFEWKRIRENDVCLIGRTRYRLIKFLQNYKEEQINVGESVSIVNQNASECQIKCRVCYSSSSERQNPLISPCKCKGSIEFIHSKCLSNWLFGRVDSSKLLHLQTRKWDCQICKADMTESEAYRKIIDKIVSGDCNIAGPLAIFEGTYNGQLKKKAYLVLSFAQQQQFKVGRGKQADICHSEDLFISRLNSIIAYRQGKIWIKDNNSKHGTGIKIKDKLQLSVQCPYEQLICDNMSIKVSYSTK